MTTISQEIASDTPRAGNPCKICTFLETLNPGPLTEWLDAIKNRSFSNSAISRALKRRDVIVSESSVSRHRRTHESQ